MFSVWLLGWGEYVLGCDSGENGVTSPGFRTSVMAGLVSPSFPPPPPPWTTGDKVQPSASSTCERFSARRSFLLRFPVLTVTSHPVGALGAAFSLGRVRAALCGSASETGPAWGSAFPSTEVGPLRGACGHGWELPGPPPPPDSRCFLVSLRIQPAPRCIL